MSSTTAVTVGAAATFVAGEADLRTALSAGLQHPFVLVGILDDLNVGLLEGGGRPSFFPVSWTVIALLPSGRSDLWLSRGRQRVRAVDAAVALGPTCPAANTPCNIQVTSWPRCLGGAVLTRSAMQGTISNTFTVFAKTVIYCPFAPLGRPAAPHGAEASLPAVTALLGSGSEVAVCTIAAGVLSPKCRVAVRLTQGAAHSAADSQVTAGWSLTSCSTTPRRWRQNLQMFLPVAFAAGIPTPLPAMVAPLAQCGNEPSGVRKWILALSFSGG